MALEPLASVDELAARLTRSLDEAGERERAYARLRDASAEVRGYTRQQFTAATGTEATVRVVGGYARLPQRPVTDVTDVVDPDGNDVTYTWIPGSSIVEVATDAAYVVITNDHGYAEIPDDVITVVCQVAGRALALSIEDSIYTSETVEGYSSTIGSTAAAGGVGLLPDEKKALNRYRRGTGSIVMR